MRLHMRRLLKMVTWQLRVIAWNFQFLLILATPFDKSGMTQVPDLCWHAHLFWKQSHYTI